MTVGERKFVASGRRGPGLGRGDGLCRGVKGFLLHPPVPVVAGKSNSYEALSSGTSSDMSSLSSPFFTFLTAVCSIQASLLG